MPANTTHGESTDNPTDAALRNVVDRIDEHGSAQFGATEGATSRASRVIRPSLPRR